MRYERNTTWKAGPEQGIRVRARESESEGRGRNDRHLIFPCCWVEKRAKVKVGWDQLGGMTKGATRGIINRLVPCNLCGCGGRGSLGITSRGDLGIACVFERHSSNLEVHRVYWVGQVKNYLLGRKKK